MLFRSRPVLVAGAAAVLLTAASCGGGGEGSTSEEAAESTSADTPSAASSPASPTSSPAPGSGAGDDPAVAQFCSQGAEFTELVAGLGTATPEQIAPILQQSVTAFDAATPPAEITADWQVLGNALRQLSDSASALDLTTTEGQQQFSRAASDASAQTGTAQANIQRFTDANCTAPAPTT